MSLRGELRKAFGGGEGHCSTGRPEASASEAVCGAVPYKPRGNGHCHLIGAIVFIGKVSLYPTPSDRVFYRRKVAG